jgi:thymidylate kinase
VRAGFLALAAAEPDRFTVVDAARDTEAVARAVSDATDRLVGSGEPNPHPARTP